MVILASEDVGNADPVALQVAVAAAHAVEHVGMPEAQYALAQAAIYLSLAPKSNAAKTAIGAARGHVRDNGAQAPPAHLQSSGYPGAAALGRGRGYDYPHDRPGRVSPQELMPSPLVGTRFYEPGDAEPDLAARLEEIRRLRGRSETQPAMGVAPATEPAPPPLESFSAATGELLGAVPSTPERDVPAAVARAAAVQRLWAQLRLRDRARYMQRAAQAVIDEAARSRS